MAQLDPSRYKRLTKPYAYASSDGLYWDTTNERLVVSVSGTVYEAPLQVASQARGDVLRRGASTWERLDANDAGKVLMGDGTDATSAAISGDIAVTGAGAVTLAQHLLRYAEVTISAASIVDTAANGLSHANGYPIVAALGTEYAIEFLGGVVIYDYATAQYGGGGNTGFAYSSGGAVSGVVAAAQCIGAAGDKVAVVLPAVPTNNQLLVNTGLNLVTASAYTQPGTAAGVARVKCAYRVHTTGL